MNTQQNIQNTTKFQQVKEQVQKLKGFYTHLAIYSFFVIVFIVLNFLTTDFPWAIFPILGWGFGILSHAAETYQWNPFLGKEWEERKIKELLEKE